MNEKSCASSNHKRGWKDIDFAKAEFEVKKLQMRIAKAVKEDNAGKVTGASKELLEEEVLPLVKISCANGDWNCQMKRLSLPTSMTGLTSWDATYANMVTNY